MWCGEALNKLGVWGIGVLLLLGGFFLVSVLQYLSKIFDLWNSSCLLLPSSHHLGSSPCFLNIGMGLGGSKQGAPGNENPGSVVVVFLMLAILTGVRWNHDAVLICISFMARDGEYFFM
jgi:hypothetical protein